MISIYKLSVVWFFCVLGIGCGYYVLSPKKEVKHNIKVIHKGISQTEPVNCTLVEVQDDNNRPIAYHMKVKSVVCGDSRCRVDMVIIYWDKIGRFKRLELPHDVALEKAEGESFSSEDYIKLDTILHDENSPLQYVYKNEIVSTVGSEGVDALTGATVLVEKSAYVKGAVWTCYSLWHWAHGDTKKIIREITGDAFSSPEIRALLKSKESEDQIFAIEEFIRRKDYSKQSVKSMLMAITDNANLLKSSIAYWELAPNDVYVSAMQQLMAFSTTQNRLIGLNAISNTQQDLPTSFFTKLNLPYSALSYQEINLLLSTITSENIVSTELNGQLILLLDNPNFLIARRIYWFLKGQNLSEKQNLLMNRFYDTHKHKL